MVQPQQAGLTGLGKVVVAVVVLGMIGIAGYVLSKDKGKGQQGQNQIDPAKDKEHITGFQKPTDPKGPEAPDLTGVTTVKEYQYVAQSRLPQVKAGATSGYKWDAATKTFKFPINVWIGWLPIIAANHGAKPNDESIFFKKYGFHVELVLVDDPVACRDGYVAGDFPVLWATLDMMVLFSEGLMKDSRTAPRIFQQIDWSNGGDGVVVRENIKTVADLKGKTVVYAQNSPSQYYLNALLIHAGVNPGEVTHKFTNTAFEAAAAFVSDRNIDACVSWAPDVYNITERVKGTRLLSTTQDANKLIADVWAMRADFAKDHPEIAKGLVAGIFEGMRLLKTDKAQAFKWMAELYSMEPGDVEKMQYDAHTTNFAENWQFFMNQNNPTNFERTWGSIKYVYRKLLIVDNPANFDQVMDFSVLQQINADGTFKDEVDEYKSTFAPRVPSSTSGTAEAPILTQTIRINFFPNSDNLYEKARDEYGQVVNDKLYDPMVDSTLEKVGKLAGQFEASYVKIVGHTDGSMKGKIPFEQVKELSRKRAEAVKKAMIEKYKFDPNKFVVEGVGWNEPADLNDSNNHSMNRRVEITILQPEAK